MYYSKNEALLREFLSKHQISVDQLRVSYEACHGPVGDEVEIRFFRTKEPNNLPALVSPDCELFTPVKQFNFSEFAEHKEFSRTVLLVVLQPEGWLSTK